MKRRKVSATLPIKIIEEMKKIKEKIGLPLSQQIELRLRGYKIRLVKIK